MTKAELERRIRTVLALPVGTVLTGDDLALAEMLLERHPNRDEKIGVGIDHWVIRASRHSNGHSLHLIRIDGSEDDFSFRRALAPRTPASARAEIRAALRDEIAPQIAEYKRQRLTPGSTRCAISYVLLDWDSTHVDHVPPTTFAALADAWIAQHPEPLLESVTAGGRRLADRALAADWQFFHLWAARLRLIHREVNTAIATTRQRAGT